MKIQILTVGKLKEKYLTQASHEYLKRLSAYANVEIREIAEEKTNDSPSDAIIEQVKAKEGERLLKHLSPDTYLFALAIEGKALSSPQLAQQIDHLTTYGNSHLTFVIGGSYGLSPSVIKRADQLLSFSKLTFPHQLIRVFLLEQIYRVCKINRGEAYHK
ncbi:23S rRNA (pseudouridine(1915)-N(3))-methyltransferase RlmH [Hazenella sp. IB182357]|uniref:Ribosomal RNA large subunit methyltransferase H n=1 Tax=Polycladospora coralii TaxID=2771432 RepID=A0A926NEK3_9BACL|nr:23S rRNA (pseudouridine(1915)-N(3))-methyltransferase RlmH [Polycladospora coralii]MBD1372003.1 23S rRNA (pseudouridine(1915)-N(3))-methyltransferase RlmH [Polycladospora coralii]